MYLDLPRVCAKLKGNQRRPPASACLSFSMPISVVCPGCHARFQVSDKFAGKKGPCPKCKNQITIPAAAEEVKVHAPEEHESGGRDVEGKLVGKPIARRDTRLKLVPTLAIFGAVLTVVIAARLLGDTFAEETMWPLRAAALVALSPLLAVAAYSFLHDEEREPYRGVQLWIRGAICGLVFAILWGVYTLIPGAMVGNYWSWFYLAPPFFIVGALAAHATLDLDTGNSIFHYCFYVLVTLGLRWLIGMESLWIAAMETV